MQKRVIDIKGKKFGRLTVMSKIENNKVKNRSQYWKCLCDCGNEHIVDGYSLREGLTKSCNCYRIEQIRNRDYKPSLKTREKISKSLNGIIPWNKGLAHSDKHRKNLRLGRLKYIIKTGKINGPNIGIHEKEILDNLELCFSPYNIKRQYPVAGYFLDGYCPTLNLTIEIDEPNHKYKQEKDSYREQQIKNELNCQFLRYQICV